MSAFAGNSACENVVKFAGLRRDVLDIIRQSNVLFSTSLHEGFPNVVIEAMSCGTPVVSTDYSDIRLILPNEWQVVGSRNPSDLADAVIRSDMRESAGLDGNRASGCERTRRWRRKSIA